MDKRSRTADPAYLAGLRRLKAMTRARFELPAGAAVMVSEAETTEPGFPPVQTVTTFWSDPETRHVFTVFKPVDAVGEDDLPPAWMKPGLVVVPENGCSCC